LKSLGDAELEIMKVLWKAGDKVSSTYILAALDGKLNWKLSTLMTVLTRLEKKGFLVCDRQTRTNLYQASIREKEYMAEESREFLEKLYDNSVENFITGLYNSKILKNTDLDELRVFLDKLEESEEWH
jgi:BlaI family penicillinase repressor